MVEKLTDKNLQLEERIETLEETVSDLEALRDIAEEQEELRVEVEHDMREELDLQLNKTREVGIKSYTSVIVCTLNILYVYKSLRGMQCMLRKTVYQ